MARDALRRNGPVMESPSVRFAATARLLTSAARHRGLEGPSFRSPPRLPRADRSLKRIRKLDRTIVSVRISGRPWDDVIMDMIEGVIAANRLEGDTAAQLRRDLWEIAHPVQSVER